MEECPEKKHYNSLAKADRLRTLLNRYGAVLLDETPGGESRHAAYFLKTIEAGLFYKTREARSDGGPLGKPYWIKETDISIYGCKRNGIEAFLSDFEGLMSY